MDNETISSEQGRIRMDRGVDHLKMHVFVSDAHLNLCDTHVFIHMGIAIHSLRCIFFSDAEPCNGYLCTLVL